MKLPANSFRMKSLTVNDIYGIFS